MQAKSNKMFSLLDINNLPNQFLQENERQRQKKLSCNVSYFFMFQFPTNFFKKLIFIQHLFKLFSFSHLQTITFSIFINVYKYVP